LIFIKLHFRVNKEVLFTRKMQSFPAERAGQIVQKTGQMSRFAFSSGTCGSRGDALRSLFIIWKWLMKKVVFLGCSVQRNLAKTI